MHPIGKVRILADDSGEKNQSPRWCLAVNSAGSEMALCTGEFYGDGESAAIYRERPLTVGKITCPDCREIISNLQKVRL